MPTLVITSLVQGTLSLGADIGILKSHTTRSIDLTVAEIEAAKSRLVSLQRNGTITWTVRRTITEDDDAAEFMPTANSSSTTAEVLLLYVDAALGNDDNTGERLTPLASITAAEALIPDIVKHEVVIEVAPHPGAGYAWPTFRARVFSGAGAAIYVTFPEVNVIVSGDVAQGGTTLELLITSGGLTPGALDGKTLEILDGVAVNNRRMIRNNTTTDIIPCAEFTDTPAGASYQVFEPDPGNRLIFADAHQPMVQGVGIPSNTGPLGQDLDNSLGDFAPGVMLINAILVPTGNDVTWSVDGRLVLIGCEVEQAAFVRFKGMGQLLCGRQAWNSVLPPSTEPSLTVHDWVGWGVFFSGGQSSLWGGSVPFVGGYIVVSGLWQTSAGNFDLSGHLKGGLSLIGPPKNRNEHQPLRCIIGRVGGFGSPSSTPSKISKDSDTTAALFVWGEVFLAAGDETEVTNLGTAPVVDLRYGCRVFFDSEFILLGTNGGDGIVVSGGSILDVTAVTTHLTVNVQGSIAGQLFRIGPRGLNAVMVDDFNDPGDFVSGARSFWDEGLTVTTHVVVMTTIGAVVAVEATTATSAGPKLIQNSATPGAGAVQVVYDATGLATLTFNTADAVTEADVYIQPEDNGTVVRAVA